MWSSAVKLANDIHNQYDAEHIYLFMTRHVKNGGDYKNYNLNELLKDANDYIAWVGSQQDLLHSGINPLMIFAIEDPVRIIAPVSNDSAKQVCINTYKFEGISSINLYILSVVGLEKAVYIVQERSNKLASYVKRSSDTYKTYINRVKPRPSDMLPGKFTNVVSAPNSNLSATLTVDNKNEVMQCSTYFIDILKESSIQELIRNITDMLYIYRRVTFIHPDSRDEDYKSVDNYVEYISKMHQDKSRLEININNYLIYEW